MSRFLRLVWLVPLAAGQLAMGAEPAADAASTSPSSVAIGKGGMDGFVAVGPGGQIHVVYGGKYRTGPSLNRLSPEESITDLQPVNTVRMTVDADGQPHVVFTTGVTSNARRSYYTARIKDRWLPAEKFADAADFVERTRAYVADVAAGSKGNVLVCFWVSRPTEKRQEYDDPCFYYRWRSPEGRWSATFSLPAHGSSAPKVEFEPGRGFFLLWQLRGTQWRLAGPVAGGEQFTEERSISTGSEILTGVSTIQNEGADFTRSADGRFIVAGNVREKFEGPVGVWATIGTRDTISSTSYLGSFSGTKRGDESGIHPVAAVDAATGDFYITLMNPSDKCAYYAVHRGGKWQLPYMPLLPDRPAPQGTLRQGPSVADVPGQGVVALVRDGEERWHLRLLAPLSKGADAPPVNRREKPVAWNALGETQTLGDGITPGICVDANGVIHIVFMGGETIYHRQADALARFGPVEELPLPEGAGNYNSPHLVCDSQGTVHLTFQRDATRASKKCWYMNFRGGKWSPPVLVLDRSASDARVNYPRLAIRDDQAFIGGFIGGGSAIARLVNIDSTPRVTGSVETPLWVAHPLVDSAGQLWVVGRDGARGHKLQRYSDDLRLLGEQLLLSRGTPTKTFEPTAAVVDPSGVIHAAGATQSPVQMVWYSNSALVAAGKSVILGPELGHDIREDAYPVLSCDARGRVFLSYRHFETGEARLTVLDESTECFAPPVTVAPAVEKRLRWNPHLAAAPASGVYVVWDFGGHIYFRPVGVK
jgi:hypothetical protein